MAAYESIVKQKDPQRGSTILNVIMMTGFMGLAIMGYNLYVNNNIKEEQIERLKAARLVAYRNLQSMAGSTSALYLSSRLTGANNAALRNCVDQGAGLCTATTDFLPIRLYVPHAAGQSSVLVSTDDPNFSPNIGRFTVSGFPSTTCVNVSACAFLGKVLFKAECPGGALSCPQAESIKVTSRILYSPNPPTQFLPWLRALKLADYPSTADLDKGASEFENVIFTRDIDLQLKQVLCPDNSAITGVDGTGNVLCTCKSGFTNNNGSRTSPECKAMEKCPIVNGIPQILLGINRDGTPYCFSPPSNSCIPQTVYNSNVDNTISCSPGYRMKGVYLAKDCDVDASGLVHCDNVEVTCCKPR